MIENIYPSDWQGTRGITSPAKKIDLGNCYMIQVMGIQPDKNENNEAFSDDIEKQAESVFENIDKILKACEASMDDVVKATIFLTNVDDFKKVSGIRDKWFAKSKPACTLAEISGLSRKGAKIEIEVMAILPKENK